MVSRTSKLQAKSFNLLSESLGNLKVAVSDRPAFPSGELSAFRALERPLAPLPDVKFMRPGVTESRFHGVDKSPIVDFVKGERQCEGERRDDEDDAQEFEGQVNPFQKGDARAAGQINKLPKSQRPENLVFNFNKLGDLKIHKLGFSF